MAVGLEGSKIAVSRLPGLLPPELEKLFPCEALLLMEKQALRPEVWPGLHENGARGQRNQLQKSTAGINGK